MIEGLDYLARYSLCARLDEPNQRKPNLLKKCSKKDLPRQFPFLDYLFKREFEEFLINKSEDSIEDLTNKAAISKLEINEFPP